jgi:uncharacterized protein (TIGR02599 family)
MELMQPANSLSIYQYTSGKDGSGKPKNLTYTGKEWFSDAFNPPATAPVHVLAENVVALVILPKLSSQEDPDGTRLAPNYRYDSTETSTDPTINPKNQLPPVVQITMVALDEKSAVRLEQTHGTTMPDFGLNMGSLFVNASQYEGDLTVDPDDGTTSLEEGLIDQNLNYRIFTTNVSIRGAKWSTEE